MIVYLAGRISGDKNYNSKGAIIERLYAEYIGKEIVDLELQGL